MVKFFKLLAMAVIVVVVTALLILLVGVGLHYLTQYIPCELLLYVLTGMLFIIVLLIGFLLTDGKD